ncbi:MAG: HEAT repeat domain-containing protein [bacterium]|nr:HEAT repeat domain-containing protein [bacterium]
MIKKNKQNIFTPRKTTVLWAMMLWTVMGAPATGARGEDATKSAYDYLAKTLSDSKHSNTAIRALLAADDKDVSPLFVAMSRSSDKKVRMLATIALGQVGGPEAIAALKKQLTGDTLIAIRAEALVNLLNLDAADADSLATAVKIDDPNIQCVAARSLARESKDPKHLALAGETLRKLSKANEKMTAAMSSLGLLAMGDSAQLADMKKLITNPDTNPTIVRLMMLQIADEKITSAEPLAKMVIESPKLPIKTRIIACRAFAETSKKPLPVIFESLRKSQSLLYRIRTLGIISQQKDAKRYLTAIGKSKMPIGAIGRFELARTTPGSKASTTVIEALELKHPIAIGYVLIRAEEDIKKLGVKASFYIPGLLKYINSVEPETNRMAQEHMLAAQASTLLANLGTPEALDGIDKILSRRYSAITRSAAAGLLRTKNKSICPIARKLLKNPYPELVTDAALTLGHFADPAATEYFSRIIANEAGRPVAEVTLASWYLLKIKKQSKEAAKQLAATIK